VLWHWFTSKAPPPVLEEGETIIETAMVTRDKGMFGGAVYNPLYLTDRRLIWREGNVLWRDRDLNVPLPAIAEVAPGGKLAHLLHGDPCLRVILRNGRKAVLVWGEADERLDGFTGRIRRQMTLFEGDEWRPGTTIEEDGRFRPVRTAASFVCMFALIAVVALVARIA
jgi:hypothetical protein